MVNTVELEVLIVRSGLTKKAIAEALGLTPMSFYKKTHNQSEFKSKELSALIKLLGIEDLETVENIFFANDLINNQH